jgi:hypothetical protein
MRWKEGTFKASHCAQYPPRTIQASTMSLLMEGSRLADELNAESASASA